MSIESHACGDGEVYQLQRKTQLDLLTPHSSTRPKFCTKLLLQSQIDAHALTYGDGFSGSHKLKEATCHFLNSQFSPWTALSPSHLAITSGVSNAVECCAWALADFGDYILVGRPYFNAFKTTFGTRAG